MVRALARQQAFSEERLRALQPDPLVEQTLFGDEYVTDVIGMIQNDRRRSCQVKPHDIPIGAREVLEKSEPVHRKRHREPTWQPIPRPRRE